VSRHVRLVACSFLYRYFFSLSFALFSAGRSGFSWTRLLSGFEPEGWVLRRDPQEHAVMSDGDWSAIEELRHRLWLERHESVSDDFIAQTRRLISERVPDENTVSALRALI
jgi:hypothetical protein